MPHDPEHDPELTDHAPTGGAPFDVRRVRARTLTSLRTLAGRLLTERSGWRSLMLTCAQYYADEAGDAVHSSLTVSPALWPTSEDHQASYDRLDDQTRWYAIPWDSNEDAVYAFAPLCNEESYGDVEFDDETGEPIEGDFEEGSGGSSALAIVQRAADGSLHARWLGQLCRPWLDFPGAMKQRDGGYDAVPDFVMDPPMPALVGREQDLYAEVLAHPTELGVRDVLRDEWMLRNDPRGEFSALTTSPRPLPPELRERAAALVLEHGRAWLGPLQPVIPQAGALFGPGPFVREAIVYAADDGTLARIGEAREWATVERLTFANQSKRLVTSAMMNLRAVGPLALGELRPLQRGTWQITELDVQVDEDDTLAPLAAVVAPITTLRLQLERGAPVPDLAPLHAASWWAGIARVEVWLADGDVTDAFTALVEQLREGCIAAVGQLCNRQRTGWTVAGTPHHRRLELVRADARVDQARTLAEAFAIAVPTELPVVEDDWLTFGLGVA